jgi:hypothetical protein
MLKYSLKPTCKMGRYQVHLSSNVHWRLSIGLGTMYAAKSASDKRSNLSLSSISDQRTEPPRDCSDMPQTREALGLESTHCNYRSENTRQMKMGSISLVQCTRLGQGRPRPQPHFPREHLQHPLKCDEINKKTVMYATHK